MGFRALCAGCFFYLWSLAGGPTALAQANPPLLVFAASSLAGVLEPALAGTAEGAIAKITYAGSGSLARAVIAGAPADLFISANRRWVGVLGRAGLVDEAAGRAVLANRLVLAAGPDIRIPDGPLTRAGVAGLLDGKYLAMGNPAYVPAGDYGKVALQWAGLWQKLQPRLVLTDSTRATAALVTRGEVPFGLIYETDARAAGLNIAFVFPERSHPPVRYVAVPVTGGRDARARQLIDDLGSAGAKTIFASFGFAPVQ